MAHTSSSDDDSTSNDQSFRKFTEETKVDSCCQRLWMVGLGREEELAPVPRGSSREICALVVHRGTLVEAVVTQGMTEQTPHIVVMSNVWLLDHNYVGRDPQGS